MNDLPKRILHVDDDHDICDIIQYTFADYKGITVQSCHDRASFEDLIVSFEPDFVLLDLKMPDFNGVDALQKMHDDKVVRNIPVVLVTGCCEVKMQDSFKKLNILGIIYKPFSPGVIPERIRHFWAVYRHGEDKSIAGMNESL